MAKAAGVSLSYVQRVWRSHGLQPHRIRTFKLSIDPAFVAKVRDIVGFYGDPRQLRRPQAPVGDRLACLPPARLLPLHTDQRLLAQRSRRLLRCPDQAQAPPGHLPRRRRPPGRHQPVPRRAQRRSKAVPLESRPRRNHRCRSQRASDVGINPLAERQCAER